MAGNPYKDKKGHYTNKENDGGECQHNGLTSNDFDDSMKLKSGKSWTEHFDRQELESKATMKYHQKVVEGMDGSNYLFDNKLVGDGKEMPQEVQTRYEQIANEAQRITDDLRGFGLNLVDTEFNTKSGTSTYRKIYKKMEDNAKYKTEMDALNSMTDIIRFTHVGRYNGLVDATQKVIDGVNKSDNYEIVEVDNKWEDQKSAYKAIHLGIRDKKTGAVFELQIHSPETLKVKEPMHKLYEEYRKLDKNDPKAIMLDNRMKKLSKDLVNLPPLNIKTLKSYKEAKLNG